MAGRKSDFTLPKFDDIFSTQEMRDDEKLAKIRDIPLELIDDFPDHPYRVQDDEDMDRLVESIKERGVITPAMVRQKEDGRYELVSGHRRKRASEIAGFDTLRCEVVELTRDEAIILMVESNYQRTQQLPSERAFAYKMRLDALARQGKRTDLTCATELHKLEGKKSRDTVADKSGETVRRYVRLTYLIPELLDLVELTEEYERMLATEDAIQNPDICWDEIQSSLNTMMDFSNPQIDRHIIRKFVSKIVPNGRNHFRWYMNLDGKDTTTIDMVTEGRKSNAVISFNDDEEDEPPLHIGDVIGLTELQQFFPNSLKNENHNGIITTVGQCDKKSSLDTILHRLLLKKANKVLYIKNPMGYKLHRIFSGSMSIVGVKK